MAYRRFNRVTFRGGKYAGIQIIGETAVTAADFRSPLDHDHPYPISHMRRAAFLATMLESSDWGTVQSYDNAGISAGPFHWVAHYPASGKQGPLFGLLRAVEVACPDFIVSEVWNLLYEQGWYVATDGQLRDTSDGSLISGKKIRDVVAAPLGVVPASGPVRAQAEKWALAFHNLLCEPESFQPQVQYAIEYLIRGQKALEAQVYESLVGIPEGNDLGAILTRLSPGIQAPGLSIIDPLNDLAMSVYHSHSVNAPGPAATCLKSALPALKGTDPAAFPKRLIRALAKTKYGAWDKRYTRTRSTAMTTLWSNQPELFRGANAIMPATVV